MVVSRVSTATQFSATISQITQKQAELINIQEQISSGQKSSTYTGLDSSVGRVIELESRTIKLEQYVSNNNLIINRLKVQDTSLSQLQSLATEFKSLLATENSSSGNTLDLDSFISSAFGQIKDNLNTKFGGRYLFAGGKTDKPAVTDASLAQSNIIDNTATSSYYLGDDLTFSTQASDELTLSYGIKANNEAFKNLIAGINKASEIEGYAFNSDSAKAAIEESSNYIDLAIDQMIAISADIQTNFTRLESVNTQHDEVKLQLETFLSDEFGTDVIEASINVNAIQATLTAIMQTFSRVSQLSLVDFLR